MSTDSKPTSRPFPGFSTVYRLSSSGSERPFHASIQVTEEESRTLPRAEEMPLCPIQARWTFGRKKPDDVIWTTWGTPVLVSDRVVTVLRDAGLTGWGTYLVDLYGHDGRPIPGYHGLSIHGQCGPIDNSKSERVVHKYPGAIHTTLAWKGMYFDPKTWDGSDLFMVAGGLSGWRFAVEEVRHAFTKAKIKDVEFTPLSEMMRDFLA